MSAPPSPSTCLSWVTPAWCKVITRCNKRLEGGGNRIEREEEEEDGQIRKIYLAAKSQRWDRIIWAILSNESIEEVYVAKIGQRNLPSVLLASFSSILLYIPWYASSDYHPVFSILFFSRDSIDLSYSTREWNFICQDQVLWLLRKVTS